MSRRDFWVRVCDVMVAGLLTVLVVTNSNKSYADSPAGSTVTATDGPNVLWIVCQNCSKHDWQPLDSKGVPTPAIASLAEHGVTFDHAFSCATTDSVAYTTLMTGCYATRIGTGYHRAIKSAIAPRGVRLFPETLRKSGYHTTQTGPHDCNLRRGPKIWDRSEADAHWKDRKVSANASRQPAAGTAKQPTMPKAARTDAKLPPFFHVEILTPRAATTPQPNQKTTTGKSTTNPEHDTLPPYFPDTAVFRHAARGHRDDMIDLDRQVRAIIGQLEQANELENTFVFCFGLHGGTLPRTDGFVFETGLHVPLVVRIPENFQQLTDRSLGSRAGGFVEFVDFAATVLTLAGIPVPESIDGEAFLGRNVSAAKVDQRREAIGHADRCDEKQDMMRSLRVGKWKYIRNFEPHYPDALYRHASYQSQAMRQWQRMHATGELNDIQAAFFRPRTPEALYDLDADPYETINLVGSSVSPHSADRANDYAETLLLMQARLQEHLVDGNDLGCVPEAFLLDGAMTDPVTFGRRNQDAIKRMLQVADLQLKPWSQAKSQVVAAIDDQDPLVRIWGLVSASWFASQFASGNLDQFDVAPIVAVVRRRLVDVEPLVVIRAVECLTLLATKKQTASAGSSSAEGAVPDSRANLYRSLQRCVGPAEALRVLNTSVFIRDHCAGAFVGDPIVIHPRHLQLIIPFDEDSLISRRLRYLGVDR